LEKRIEFSSGKARKIYLKRLWHAWVKKKSIEFSSGKARKIYLKETVSHLERE
jgi:hypothetical protein